MKHLKLFEITNPYRNSDLRKQYGFRPKYKMGVIAIRFETNDNGKIINDNGEIMLNLHENSDFINWFENKYNIKMNNSIVNIPNDLNNDPYYHYFKCKQGEEEKKIKEISKSKFVIDADFVDLREIDDVNIMQGVVENLKSLMDYYQGHSDKEIQKRIEESIEDLKKILK